MEFTFSGRVFGFLRLVDQCIKLVIITTISCTLFCLVTSFKLFRMFVRRRVRPRHVLEKPDKMLKQAMKHLFFTHVLRRHHWSCCCYSDSLRDLSTLKFCNSWFTGIKVEVSKRKHYAPLHLHKTPMAATCEEQPFWRLPLIKRGGWLFCPIVEAILLVDEAKQSHSIVMTIIISTFLPISPIKITFRLIRPYLFICS